MKNNAARKSGFTLVEIMIVVAIIGLLASIAIPNLNKARATAQTNVCINNLRTIAGAKDQWGMEQHKQTSDTPAGSDIQPYLGRTANGELPACPNATSCRPTTFCLNEVFPSRSPRSGPCKKPGTRSGPFCS
jgi:prepilin-type N-terminal cleavage/methylation domain-containing protein